MGITLQRSFDDLGTPLSQVTFVVVDVETTGGSPATSSLTEVAAARYRGGELLGTYQTFVRPDARIPPFITALTGITDAMVAGAPRIGEMLPSFLEFVGGAVLVGHNLRFDLSFLDHALESTGRERLANATVDTLALARRLVRDMVPDCKLGTLASTLGLSHQPSHRALNDVLATGDLLHAMLERAGSFGILGLEELLDLPRLVGHPQAAKLRLTIRLPHRPGVYWFADGAGQVLYVGKAADLQARVRSYFTGDGRHKVGRLLRQMQAVHHHVCPGSLSAAVVEGRLIRAWSPPFNQQGQVRRTGGSTGASSSPVRAEATARTSRRRGRRPTWTTEQLEGNPSAVLAPLAGQVAELAGQQRYEDAAAVRDEAERLRRLITGHRRVESIRRAGRMVLSIGGEGIVELDRGLLVAHRAMPGCGPAPELPAPGDGHDNERIIVAQWLDAHADEVRILEVGPVPGPLPGPDPGRRTDTGMGTAPGRGSVSGLAVPAVRIPSLAELCGAGSRRSRSEPPIP